ncbi:MAG: hypothetical protein JNL58_02140 [Planctomyces sp.]|nr:hypothetical protein [Planctomyces sp.]
MGVSFILLAGIVVSLVIGFLIVWIAAHFSTREGQKHRAAILLPGVLFALMVNSWWVFLTLMVFFQLFVLRRDP